MDVVCDSRRYEEIEHTADVRLKVYGADERDLFANAAFALFDTLVDLSGVEAVLVDEVTGSGADLEETLVTFLGELLYRFEGKGRVYRDFEVLRLAPGRVVCACRGERYDAGRHETKAAVKAVTFHNVEIKRDKAGLSVVITLDV